MSGGEAEREGDTGSEAGSRLSTEPDMGLEITDLRIMTLSQSRMLNRLSHPGTPHSLEAILSHVPSHCTCNKQMI